MIDSSNDVPDIKLLVSRRWSVQTTSMSDKAPPRSSNFSLHSVVGYRLKRAYMVVNEDYKADPALARLTNRQFTVLSLVAEKEEVSQSDIARRLGIERSGMVKLIDQLEAKGFLRRMPNPTDRRVYQLELTAKGHTCWSEHLKAVKAHEDRLLANLSAEERSSLISLLQRIQRPN